MIPNDPTMLASFINMKLRDEYDDPEDFCKAYELEWKDLLLKMEQAGYKYCENGRCFRMF